MPKPNDESLMRKFENNHSQDKFFKINPRNKDAFEIIHYADTVKYEIDGFIVKNKNTLNADVIRTMIVSGSAMISQSFNMEEENTEEKSKGKFSRNQTLSKNTALSTSQKTSMCTLFKRDLQDLADLLESSERHYVRCIKPNDDKKADYLNQLKLLKQLKSNGVLETVILRKAGYANKMGVDVFFNRYCALGVKSESKASIEQFLKSLKNLDKDDWAIGKSKVFLRTSGMAFLENLRKERLESKVLKFQCWIRVFLAKEKYNTYWLEKKRKLELIQREKASLRVQSLIRRYIAITKLKNLREEKRKKKEERLEKIRKEEEEKKKNRR